MSELEGYISSELVESDKGAGFPRVIEKPATCSVTATSLVGPWVFSSLVTCSYTHYEFSASHLVKSTKIAVGSMDESHHYTEIQKSSS